MKKTFFITILLLFSLSIFAQIDKRKQVSPRINVSLVPHVEFIKVAGNMNLAAGVSVITTINNLVYYGFYLTKKLQKDYIDFGEDGGKLDFNTQRYGVVVGGYVPLGIYRGTDGRYMKRKTVLTCSANFGHSVFWTNNEGGEKVSAREYFYTLQPSIGATRQVGKYIFVEAGVRYPIALRIDPEWEAKNITNNEFTGPGVYLSLRFNLFH